MKRANRSAALAALVLAACSNAASPVVPSAPPAGVTFAVSIPGSGAVAARSVVVTLDGAVVATVELNGGSCRNGARGRRTCTAQTTLPAGSDTFDAAAYDQPRGAGNVLASGSVVATLTAGEPATVRLALSGEPASIALSISQPYPRAGSALTVRVWVGLLDADGNTILGRFTQPVTLADGDTSGATKLSTTSLAASSTRVTLAYDGAPLQQATLTASAGSMQPAVATFAPAPTIVEQYNVPDLPGKPFPVPAGLSDICLGPDGNLWGTDSSSGGIDRITLSGHFTAYPIPRSNPMGISVGSDGDLWFVETSTGKLAKITTQGKITAYPIPHRPGATPQPSWTARGPDGRTWFVDQGLDVAGAIAGGKIVEYPLPRGSFPEEFVAGPDGNLWITDSGRSAILVMTTSGKIVAIHHLPLPQAAPWGIAVGPDGKLWFAEFNANEVASMTTAGKLRQFTLPTSGAGPLNVAAGPDGNVWFTESGGGFGLAGKIGFLRPDGSLIRDFPMPGNLLHVHNLAFDGSGALWLTEFGGTISVLGKMIY